MELCPFVVRVLNFDYFPLDLYGPRLEFLLIEHVIHEAIGNASLSDSRLPDEDKFVVEVRTVLVEGAIIVGSIIYHYYVV